MIDFSELRGRGRRLRLRVGDDESHRSRSRRTSTRACATTRSRSSTTSAAASRSRCRTRASRSWRGRPVTPSDASAVRAAARAAATRSTSRAAGTTRATTASTWSTAASRCGTLLEPLRAQRGGRSADAAFARRQAARCPRRATACPICSTRRAVELEFCSRCRCRRAAARRAWSHHKMHGMKWTELGTAPARGRQPSASCMPPSTAATLNLAAVAAQAARLCRDDRPGVQQALPRGAQARLDRGARAPDASTRRPRAARRRRSVRRQRRARRVLLGGGRAARHDRRGEVPRSSSSARPRTRSLAGRGRRRRRTLDDLAARRGGRHAQPRALAPQTRWARSATARAPRSCARADGSSTLRAREGYGIPFAPGAETASTRGARTRSCSTTRSCSALAHDFTRRAQVPRRRRGRAWTTCSAATRSISRT